MGKRRGPEGGGASPAVQERQRPGRNRERRGQGSDGQRDPEAGVPTSQDTERRAPHRVGQQALS